MDFNFTAPGALFGDKPQTRSLSEEFARMGYHPPFSIANLKKALVARFKADLDEAGLNGSLIPDGYIATPSLSAPGFSMRSLIGGWQQPGIERWTERRIANTGEEAWESQGVTHSSERWYFTQKNEIFTRHLPLHPDGTTDRTVPWRYDPLEPEYSDCLLKSWKDMNSKDVFGIQYDHFGAPCYFEDGVFLPLEPVDKNSNPALLVRYNKSLTDYSLVPLAFFNPFIGKYQAQGQSGWVAINAVDRCIYTSSECTRISGLGGAGYQHIILVYDLDSSVHLQRADLREKDWKWYDKIGYVPSIPRFLGFFPAASFRSHYEDKAWADLDNPQSFGQQILPHGHYRSPKFPLDNICGGVFDGEGRLFLSIGENISGGSSDGRILCYSAYDGSPLGCRVSGTLCSASGFAGCEAEGLTIWDGEIFLVTLHNGGDYSDMMNLHVYSPPGTDPWTGR